jgi:hypothetical protein
MTVKVKPMLTKVHETRWRMDGVNCGCGGTLYIDRNGSGEWRYETFCQQCLTCDVNGWRTLRQCLEESPEYFAAIPARPAW